MKKTFIIFSIIVVLMGLIAYFKPFGHSSASPAEELGPPAPSVEPAFKWQDYGTVDGYIIKETGDYVELDYKYYKGDDGKFYKELYNTQTLKGDGHPIEVKGETADSLLKKVKNAPNGKAGVEINAGGKRLVWNDANGFKDESKYRIVYDQNGNVKIIIYSNSTRSPAPVGGDVLTNAFGGAGTKGNYSSIWFGSGPNDLAGYIQDLYRWATALGIVVAILMIIWGGYTYATSGGEIEKINNAKENIVGAVIGLVILMLAALILNSLGVSLIG